MVWVAFKQRLLLYWAAIALLLIANPVNAAINIIGQYNGEVSGFILGSPPQAANQGLVVRITNQAGNNFTGSFILLPSKLTTSFNGMFVGPNQINVVCNGSATIAAGPCFAALVDGNRLRIPNAGQTGSMVINATAGNTVELGGLLLKGNVVAPSTSPSTSLKDAGAIKSEILGVTAPIQQHLVKTLRADTKGFNLNQQGFLLEGESGLNAGDIQLGNLGVWLSYNFRNIENDFAPTAFESSSHTAIGGVDYSPNDSVVIGLAIAYENSDTDTTFNAGNLETDGITVVPYFGVLLSDTWSLDASMGFSFIENDQFRTDPTTFARISSNPDTDRFFATANLNGVTYYDNWVIGGRIGYLFAKSETEEFTESDGSVVGESRAKLGQIRIGGDLAYQFQSWEPYVSAIYEYDYQFEKIELLSGPQPANDRDDILFTTGFRYYDESGLNANFEYSKRFLREQFDEDSWTLTVRYDF